MNPPPLTHAGPSPANLRAPRPALRRAAPHSAAPHSAARALPVLLALAALILLALAVPAAAQSEPPVRPYDTGDAFPWAVHIVTVPLTILVGVLIGWAIAERRYSRELAAMMDKKRSDDEAKTVSSS